MPCSGKVFSKKKKKYIIIIIIIITTHTVNAYIVGIYRLIQQRYMS